MKMFLELSGDTVNIYYVMLNEVLPLEITHLVTERLLDETEKTRLCRLKGRKQRKQFVVGRMLIKKVLADYLMRPVTEIRLGQQQYGKLQLAVAPPAISLPAHFNLSHAENIVACSLTAKYENGIDVEYKQRTLKGVDVCFFHPKEIEYMERTPVESRGEIACQLWTLKEAYAKARGMGLSIPFSGFNVLEIKDYFFHSAVIEDDYYLSVAVENPDRVCFRVQKRKIALSRLFRSDHPL